MFRVFVRCKLLDGAASGKKTKKTAANQKDAKARQRNRRVFERYPIDHKHLTLMNEQDILVVREISAKGFSTEVSKRGWQRLNIGDVYEARIRYLGEVYDLQAKVSWKAETFVGFEIVKANRETLVFLKRLLRPIEIANSLREVNSSFMNGNEERKTWYHGDEGTDLYLWRDDAGVLSAWQLVMGQSYVEWKQGEGLVSGELAAPQSKDSLLNGGIYTTIVAKDHAINSQTRQYFTDVIMALQLPVRDELVGTISE